jgi:molecular chaperone GrpE (heat shock protein)
MKKTDCNDCNEVKDEQRTEKEQELENLKSDLNTAKKELEGNKKKILYIMADLENSRRNSLREIENQTTRSTVKVIEEFLHVLDDFERCLESEKEYGNINLEGLQMIHRSFLAALEKLLVIEIPTDSLFDPSTHEAISFIEQKESNKKHNEIHSVAKKGYKYKDSLIRPSQVVVIKDEKN